MKKSGWIKTKRRGTLLNDHVDWGWDDEVQERGIGYMGEKSVIRNIPTEKKRGVLEMLSNRKTKKMPVMKPITKNKVARKKVIAMIGQGNYERGRR